MNPFCPTCLRAFKGEFVRTYGVRKCPYCETRLVDPERREIEKEK